MLYLHDVWVNWFEGEENGYSVCYFMNGGKMTELSCWIRFRCYTYPKRFLITLKMTYMICLMT